MAFTFLLDSYWNEVYGFMLQRTENETDAEDITIETFSKAFDKIATYNPEFQFNTWLIAIAKNVHIDLLRKKKSSLFIDITDEEDDIAYSVADTSPSAEDKLITEQNLSRLLQFIKELKPAYQEVIQAIRFDGQVSVFDPRSETSPCYHCVYPETDEFEETACAELGVFAPLVGIVGSLQAAEALKLLANIDGAETLCGRLLTIDAKSMELVTLRLQRDAHCGVCGH